MHSSRSNNRTLKIALGLILALSVGLVFGMAAQDDPIQAGYAIITPTSANTAGLTAFETFGQKQGPGATQAGVLPATMTKRAVLFVSTSGRLSSNLGVAIANPGDKDAALSLTLRGPDGVAVATKPVVVTALQQTAEFVTQMFSGKSAIPTEFTGTLDIVSDNPVAVIGLRFRGNNFSTLPSTSLGPVTDVSVVATGIGGTGAVILPQFATGGGWATEIVLVNAGTEDLTVRVDLFGQDGKALVASLNGVSASSFTDIKIVAGGVVTLSPRDANGDSEF